MTAIQSTINASRPDEDRQSELDALWEAFNSCDEDTYKAVISLLGLEEAGSQLV